MPVKIRLSRHGKKGRPLYHIVVADSRSPRDGKYIEKIGTYNPVGAVVSVQLDSEKALAWLNNGAQPTDTVRTILSAQGVMLQKHLAKGVEKGLFNQELADQKFSEWRIRKDDRINEKARKVKSSQEEIIAERLKAESKVREAKAKALSERLIAESAKAAEAAAPAPDGEVTPAESADQNQTPAEN